MPLWNKDILMQVNVTAEVGAIETLELGEFLSEYEELASEETEDGRSVATLGVRGIYFRLAYEQTELLRVEIYGQILGFYNWMATQSASILAC